MDLPDVVLFARTLGRKVSGGTRAVLHRANLFADMGYPVSLLITGQSSDIEVARLRSTGVLHPAVDVQHFWVDAPDWTDYLAAAERQPVDIPRLDEHTPGLVRRVESGRSTRTVWTQLDGIPRSAEATDSDGGAVRSFRQFDENGDCIRIWRFVDGRVAMVDDLVDDVPVFRKFYVDGRYCWLSADIQGQSGTGRAEYADGRVTDYAGAIAAWVDRRFADRSEIVVFADGENVWQRVLRRLDHPGVRGVSVLHNSHLDAPYDSKAPTKPEWEPYFTDTRHVDVLVCLTGQQRADLDARYPGLPLSVVHHAVPAGRIAGSSRGRKNAIFLGRLAEQKRLEDLVAVWSKVVQLVPGAVLDVYGTGPEAESFRASLEEAGLINNVVLHGHTTDPLGKFAAARVAIMTSWYEGLPLTLTEGMSVGTPWVAYDLNYGPSEVIRSSVDGFLVPSGDVDACAQRVARLLTDDELAARMSLAAREVSRRFSRDRYRKEWVEVLERARESGRNNRYPDDHLGHDHLGCDQPDHDQIADDQSVRS